MKRVRKETGKGGNRDKDSDRDSDRKETEK